MLNRLHRILATAVPLGTTLQCSGATMHKASIRAKDMVGWV
jgi:hypothetical protein